MGTPLNQRPNSIFLSHSSRDKNAFVDNLYRWLTRCAGLKVWYDRGLASGFVSSNLNEAIDSCRAALIVLSENSNESPWVRSECERIQKEWADYRGEFRIATIRLDAVEAPGLLESFKHIDAPCGILDVNSASLLMETLFGGRDHALGRPVYLSRGWRPTEMPAAQRLCDAIKQAGLKLVCDSIDQPHYDVARVKDIMDSTGGFVAVLPHRGNGMTSSYLIREIATARDLNLPCLIFAEKGIAPKPEWNIDDCILFDGDLPKMTPQEVTSMFGGQIEELAQAWKKPNRGEHAFLGHSLEESISDNFSALRRMISRLTGLPVESGGLVTGQEAQSEIIRLIRDAEFCIIDITNSVYDDLPAKIDFALNSCIEAGIALGTGKENSLYLTCRGERRTPPFMFRNKQVWFYVDELELVGNLRQISASHRRTVL
jgi:TIR domain